MQMAHEVTVACGIFRRDNGEAVREGRKGEGGLKVHEPFGLETCDGLLSFELPDSDRIVRIYVAYDQRKTVELAVADLNLDQHDHSGRYRRACDRLEVRSYESVL